MQRVGYELKKKNKLGIKYEQCRGAFRTVITIDKESFLFFFICFGARLKRFQDPYKIL